ncbi:InlB B-repeat-containing protein [Pelotomaculum sp. PtaB.Bin117]|uniref:InlB B-repeat-containing protein n=1 Tax=Pelotomaculum sp. PtaB.Bin117 TaxID=1811694 RepID=UPI00257A5E60|nr:InlB B-repeat-containing protein [Pelotomaculum sp. PtaB.Bin117]
MAFAGFASKSITASPANGTTLSVATHNGQAITPTCNSKTATTNNLTVSAAPAISPTSCNYDLNAPADITATITWNSAVSVTDAVYSIRPDVTVYTLDSDDYTVAGNGLTIENSFFSDLPLTTGAALDFVFTFNTGATATLTVNVVDGFVAVTDISRVPAAATAGTPLTLIGTVSPANATNQTVTWSVYNAGDTGASISGDILSTTAAGVAVVRATVTNGLTASSDYTQDFNITVNAAPVTTYTVTFSSNGGTYATKTVNAGESIGSGNFPSDPTRSSYSFGGWFTGENGAGTEFTSATPVNATMTVYAKWTYGGGGDGDNDGDGDNGGSSVKPSEKTITVTETSSGLFSGSMGKISVSANMDNAFSNSVEVKVTDTGEDKASFQLGAGDEFYPFDISLYIKGTNEKTQPAPGYAVTISLPVPENLLDKKELLDVVHKSDSGKVTTLASRLEQRNGVWYLVFEATEFSPYALVVRRAGSYDESAGVPYYLNANGNKVFIGLAANGKYIAPEGVTVSVM